MQAQHPCVPPVEVPFLEDTSTDASSLQPRGVLQERSANQPQECPSGANPSQPKRSGGPHLTENAQTQRPVSAGTYYTGNEHAQHVGLAGFDYGASGKAGLYQKYREKQPVTTVAEVIQKDAAQKKEAERRKANGEPKDTRDNTVGPEWLEHAFWRAMVRWPLPGKRKYILNGRQRGRARNELIYDSIYRDTGIERNRKQISSHLQVLRPKFVGFPAILAYLPSTKTDTKRCQKTVRQSAKRTGAVSKYEYAASSPHLSQQFVPQSNAILSEDLESDLSSSPFTVADFTMLVGSQNRDQPDHYFTQLHPNGRLDGLNVTDASSWHRQHPEFDFFRSQTDIWRMSHRKVFVCDASIKVMTESRPNADLVITFNLYSYVNLSRMFESLECTTRFYDGGNMAPDPQLDNGRNDLKEHRTPCEFTRGPKGTAGNLRIDFGSPFWVDRMAKYTRFRYKDENCVRDSLLRLTATQNVYGIKLGGEAQCLFTVLWRFQQTRNSAEVGSMKWREVGFANCQMPSEKKWIQEQEYKAGDMENMEDGHEEEMDCPVSASEDISLYHQASQLPLGFSHPPTVHSYAVQPNHDHHHPQLSLDIMASIQPDLNISEPTTATDYLQQGFALSQTQDTVPSHAHDHDFHFNGGHISMSGAFEPAIHLSAYEDFASQSTSLQGLHALAGLEHDGFASLGLADGEHGQLVPVGANGNDVHDVTGLACCSTKPNWQHANLISHLENAAEQYHYHHDQASHGHEVLHAHDVYPHVSQGEEIVTHGLHDAHVDIVVHDGLWGLQSPFHEDTGSGAANGVDCRKFKEQAHGLGFGVLDLIERDERERGY
ncbi:hypothetical protein BDW02DRAFT_581921 [Decorospora gaudefroyi]|uniref:TEA domain-containing protein n=1 Tax=Decorospora gaudefroyi TaxID=184978 RepID=A0A6A5K3F1_9PLEO|nr:hypothetical protein BDW02DRAFT_581921 [Decorospora gaudefroyi]